MISFVNAKINLGLNILRKRQDGYHELDTVFYPVGIYNGTPVNPEPFNDILEIHPCESLHEDEFSFSGIPVDCPLTSNLVFKAANLFRLKACSRGIEIPGLKIYLSKHIPHGAGLGGGSADAAFTLLTLNSLFEKPFSREELIEMAVSLGADCPFFIENRPVLATGIGEIMRPLELDLSDHWAVIVKPDIFISTKEAFSGIAPRMPETSISKIIALPPESWESSGLRNDFEPHIFRMYPALAAIKSTISHYGSAYTSMSGSGSSIFGIFSNEERARDAFSHFKNDRDTSSQTSLCKL